MGRATLIWWDGHARFKNGPSGSNSLWAYPSDALTRSFPGFAETLRAPSLSWLCRGRKEQVTPLLHEQLCPCVTTPTGNACP